MVQNRTWVSSVNDNKHRRRIFGNSITMTTVTKYSVACPCGHIGAIKMKENDQPFSGQWESYSLIDLNGSSTGIEGGVLQWDKVFADMKPTCPKCGTILTQKNLS